MAVLLHLFGWRCGGTGYLFALPTIFIIDLMCVVGCYWLLVEYRFKRCLRVLLELLRLLMCRVLEFWLCWYIYVAVFCFWFEA